LGEFGSGSNDFYFLTGIIEYTDFEPGDWVFAYINNPGEKSPKTASVSVVPEPSTALLIGTGLIGLGVFRRRLRKS
jgi:hypothetical protein